ncbi:hypothetical protein BGZ81_000660 [Podila clonocystis]|nr:hypothetical protein BGZ81_000660 [Podila clonocystis]
MPEQEREPNWCLSALDKTQRSILGQAWLVHKKVPPPDTMEWMAKLIDSNYKIVRYWFHCRVNFEAINKAMAASPDTGVLMPGIDNWYELEYFTHPPGAPAYANSWPSFSRTPATTTYPRASSNKTLASTACTAKQRTKQTTKHNKPETSKERPKHFRDIQESSDDSISDDHLVSDAKGNSLERERGAPSAFKKRQAPSTVDELEASSMKNIHATSSHPARRTEGCGIGMRGMDIAEQEPPRKLSRYSSTNLKNIEVTVEIPPFQRRSSRRKKDATPADPPTRGMLLTSSSMMLEESATLLEDKTGTHHMLSDDPTTIATLLPANQPMDEAVHSGRQPLDKVEHTITLSVAKVNEAELSSSGNKGELSIKSNKAESSTKENKAESLTLTAVGPFKVSQRIDENSHGSALSTTRVTRRQGNRMVSTLKINPDESIVTKSLSFEPFASIKIKKRPKESGPADMPLPTDVLPDVGLVCERIILSAKTRRRRGLRKKTVRANSSGAMG